MSTVTANEPIRVDGLFGSIGAAEGGAGPDVVELQRRDLRVSFDNDAHRLETFLKQAFSVGLRQHQRIWVGALH